MDTKLNNSLIVLIAASIISGCGQTLRKPEPVVDAPTKPYVAPPPPRKISFISGAAITNIIAGNTLDKLQPYMSSPSRGDYTYYSKGGRVYPGSQYQDPAVWYVLDDRFCTRTLKFNLENCYRIELDNDKIVFHDARSYGFRADSYKGRIQK